MTQRTRCGGIILTVSECLLYCSTTICLFVLLTFIMSKLVNVCCIVVLVFVCLLYLFARVNRQHKLENHLYMYVYMTCVLKLSV